MKFLKNLFFVFVCILCVSSNDVFAVNRTLSQSEEAVRERKNSDNAVQQLTQILAAKVSELEPLEREWRKSERSETCSRRVK